MTTRQDRSTESEVLPDKAVQIDDKRYSRYAEDADAQFDVKKAKFEFTKERASIELDKERWKNRRKMAWLSMFAMIAATYGLFFLVSESRLQHLGEVIAWFYMAMASVIGTYLGTTTWAYVSTAGRKRPRRGSAWDNGYGDSIGGGYGGGYGGGRLDNPEFNKNDYYSER